MKSLSVFFPAYNEDKNLEKVVLNAIGVFKKIPVIWEIIIVNDGSNDETLKVAEKLSRKFNLVRVINQPNGGYGMAIRAGLENAKYEWIAYTDADGQFEFSDILTFIPQCEKADAIWGYKLKRKDPFYRSLFSFCWSQSVRLLTGVKLRDINCGFKMFKKSAIEKILPLESTRGAMINPELALKLKRKGFKIIEMGVHHYPRLFGNSTGASLLVIIRSYLELFNLCSKGS